jgi:SPASM domain peptide maturase of grasp-with-spasm system
MMTTDATSTTTPLRYRLNPSSFLVKGFGRSMICDLGRSQFYLIPNALAEIIDDKSIDKISEAQAKYGQKNPDVEKTIEEYFKFLMAQDLLLFSNQLELYPILNTEWDVPAEITNAIIDLDESSDFNMIDVVLQLAGLGCRNIQIRSYTILPQVKIRQIMQAVDFSLIESVQWIIPYQQEQETEMLIALAKKYPRIRFIQLYDAPSQEILYTNPDQSMNIVTIKESLIDERCCGVIAPEYFSVALSTYTESLKYNTCLNKKISIDRNGEIKSCPSMTQTFGNIRNTSLIEVLMNSLIKNLWSISKDQIAVCKDCEFRHICTDCRAYVDNPSDQYSKPLKCGYDPYSCTWDDWSQNPLKQQAINYYNLRTTLT